MKVNPILGTIAKDVRHARLELLFFLTSVFVSAGYALANASSMTAPEDAMLSVPLSMLLVHLSGGLLLHTVIRSDSPVQRDAFWRATSISTTELGVAKAGFVLAFVLGPVLLATTVALLSFTGSFGESLSNSFSALWVAIPGFLTVAVLLASTSSVTWFLVTLVGLYAASIFIHTLIQELVVFAPGYAPTTTVPEFAATAFLLLWIGFLYLSRHQAAWMTRLGSALIVLISSFGPETFHALQARQESTRIEAQTVDAPGLDSARITITGAGAELEFTAPAPPPGHRYFVWALQAELVLPGTFHPTLQVNGGTHGVIIPNNESRRLRQMHKSSPQVATSFTDSVPGSNRVRVHMALQQPDRSDRWPIGTFQSQVRLRGFLGLQSLDTITTITLRSDSTQQFEGVRIRAQQEKDSRGNTRIGINARSVWSGKAPTPAMKLTHGAFVTDSEESSNTVVATMTPPSSIPEFVNMELALASGAGDIPRIERGSAISSIVLPLFPTRVEYRSAWIVAHKDSVPPNFTIDGATITATRWKQLSYRAFDLTAPVREP